MSVNEVQNTAQPDSPVTELPTEGTMYDWIGGEAAVRKLVDRFYEVMDSAEYATTIRAMHKEDLSPIRAGLFEYLSGWLGGPPLYIAKHGSPCISKPHMPFKIDQAASTAWVDCMNQAMLDTGLESRYRELLTPAFERIADTLINTRD